MRDASGDPSLRAFASPDAHKSIADMIRRHSTNREDVHETLMRGLDLSFAREVLDLGCGFGLFSGKIAARVAPDARMTGVDACATNEGPFRLRVERAGRSAHFTAMHIGSSLPWADGVFDLVLSSYSLYFFPEVLPEMARVLAPRGCALVLTHSRRSFRALLSAAGLDPASSALSSLVERFPAESAGERLAACFATVERVDYPNTLRFGPEDLGDVLAYMRFKLPLLAVDLDARDMLPETMRDSIARYVASHDGLIEDKNDTGFRCWGPRH